MPVAKPDKIKNIQVLKSIIVIVPKEPTIITIIHEKTKTILVRIAVATLELVFLIPTLASIDVIPAKKAERTENISHIFLLPLKSYHIILYAFHFLINDYNAVSFLGIKYFFISRPS